MNNNIAVGIDIGGSHITAALVDLQTHAVIRESLVRRPVNALGDADRIIQEWTDAIAACKTCLPHTSTKIGIAMPGPFDYEKGISLIEGLDKYESLYGLNVKVLLAKGLCMDESNIHMMNDASCFLKGEVFGGTARGADNVIGITLGTGLGSATSRDGVVSDGDLYCMPYKDGTAESYLSTRWFVKEYAALTGTTLNNVKELKEKVPGDGTAAALFEAFGRNLGEVLALYIKKHGAETVVVGGNIAHAWTLFIPETEKILHDHALNILPVKAMLGEEAALLGAGALCF